MGTVSAGWGVQADAGGLVDTLARSGFDVEAPVAVTSTVFDTFDGRLHDAGLRVEHDGTALVLGGAGTVPARLDRDAAPRFARELPPGPLRDRLADLVEVRALLPVVTVSAIVRRAVSRNGDGKVVSGVRIVEQVATDHGRLDGWLVEVDELTGYDKQAGKARALITGTGVTLTDSSDALALAITAAGVDLSGHTNQATVPLDPDMPAIAGFRQVLANLLATVDDNLPGTFEDIDPEFLHDLRVAVRRSRSILRHGKKVLPEDVLAWSRPDLKEIGRLTGPPRDLDVLVEEWDGYVRTLGDGAGDALAPVRAQLAADRDAAHRKLSADLVSAPVVERLDRWRRWLASVDGAPGPHAERPLADVVVRRIGNAERRLLDHGRAITPDTPAEHVHEVRKDAKRLRYLLECFGSLLPSSERKAFVKRLKALQDNLGEHQDAEVHAGMLRTIAGELPATTPPATLVALGQLVEQLEQRRVDAREAFADRFADYDSKATRKAMRAMLGGAGG
jgi:CHAD domain-containing protein